MSDGIARLPEKSKPLAAAGKDPNRPNIHGGEIVREGEEWVLYVTDSYKLARIPLQVEGDALTEGPLSNDALKEVTKTGAFRANAVIEPLQRGSGASTGITLARPERGGKFPSCRELIPDESYDRLTLTLDAGALKNLADALGAGHRNTVTMHLDLNTRSGEAYLKPIRVTAGRNGQVGVFMPTRPA